MFFHLSKLRVKISAVTIFLSNLVARHAESSKAIISSRNDYPSSKISPYDLFCQHNNKNMNSDSWLCVIVWKITSYLTTFLSQEEIFLIKIPL